MTEKKGKRRRERRKRICVALLLTVCTLVSGCSFPGSEDFQEDAAEDKISVVTTIFPQYDFVRQVAGDRVDLKMLLKPGEESHSYEPTPQDIIAIQNCDIFIYVGG